MPLREISEQIVSIITGQDMARNLIYLVGNLVGFAPLGFFLPTLFASNANLMCYHHRGYCNCVLELLQLMTMRGSFDIDDIILNTVGLVLVLDNALNQSAALLNQKPKGEH